MLFLSLVLQKKCSAPGPRWAQETLGRTVPTGSVSTFSGAPTARAAVAGAPGLFPGPKPHPGTGAAADPEGLPRGTAQNPASSTLEVIHSLGCSQPGACRESTSRYLGRLFIQISPRSSDYGLHKFREEDFEQGDFAR